MIGGEFFWVSTWQLVATSVPNPSSATVAQNHSPRTIACFKTLTGNGGRCCARKCVELKIRVSVVRFRPWPPSNQRRKSVIIPVKLAPKRFRIAAAG